MVPRTKRGGADVRGKGSAKGITVSQADLAQFLENPHEMRLSLHREQWQAVSFNLLERAKALSRTCPKREFNTLRHLILCAGIAYDKGYPEAQRENVDKQVNMINLIFSGSGVGEKMQTALTQQRIPSAAARSLSTPSKEPLAQKGAPPPGTLGCGTPGGGLGGGHQPNTPKDHHPNTPHTKRTLTSLPQQAAQFSFVFPGEERLRHAQIAGGAAQPILGFGG